MEWVLVFLIGLVIFGGLGAWIGNIKGGREGEGVLLGVLLGPIGLIIVAVLPGAEKNQRFSRIKKSNGGEWQQGTVVIPNGVKLRCPNCGEEGAVPKLEDGAIITCPTCKEQFDPQRNLASA